MSKSVLFFDKRPDEEKIRDDYRHHQVNFVQILDEAKKIVGRLGHEISHVVIAGNVPNRDRIEFKWYLAEYFPRITVVDVAEPATSLILAPT